jgi:hypothetical protein
MRRTIGTRLVGLLTLLPPSAAPVRYAGKYLRPANTGLLVVLAIMPLYAAWVYIRYDTAARSANHCHFISPFLNSWSVTACLYLV